MRLRAPLGGTSVLGPLGLAACLALWVLPAGASDGDVPLKDLLGGIGEEPRPRALAEVESPRRSGKKRAMRDGLLDDADFSRFLGIKRARLERGGKGEASVLSQGPGGKDVRIPIDDAFDRFSEWSVAQSAFRPASSDCVPAGSPCRWSLDCCGASRCKGGACEGTDSSNCAPAGGLCSSSLDCCGGFCRDGVCGGVGNNCVAAGGRCGTATDCCAGFCQSGRCGGVGGNCVPAGGYCSTANDCCGGFCTNGVCGGVGNNCAPPGASCNNSVDCCGGFCSNGICGGGGSGGCSPIGSRCNVAMDCCGGSLCNGGLCSSAGSGGGPAPAPPQPSCVPASGACVNSEQCCLSADSCHLKSPPCIVESCIQGSCNGYWRR